MCVWTTIFPCFAWPAPPCFALHGFFLLCKGGGAGMGWDFSPAPRDWVEMALYFLDLTQTTPPRPALIRVTLYIFHTLKPYYLNKHIIGLFYSIQQSFLPLFFFFYLVWGPTISGTQTTLEKVKPNIWPHRYGLCKRVPGLMSYLKVKEYPRTISKRRNKVLVRGEVKNASGDLTMSEDYSHLSNSIRGVW